jgi:quinoprotein glucose dehydrogenase
MNRLRLCLALALACPALAFAQNAAEPSGDGAKKKDRDPENVSLEDSGESALKKFSVAPGLRVDLWAAEPLLANPVAFAFDDKGRAFVVETYRRRTSVPSSRAKSWRTSTLTGNSTGATGPRRANA